MNRTKHMKHKKNTRRRHKLRNTHKRYKKYNRCRTRSQRGGKTKAEVYDDVLSEMLNHKELIPLYFIHNTFDTFLKLYGKDVLKRVVCGDYSEEAIRLDATTQLANMKRILDSESEPTPNIVKLKDLFLNRNFTQNWTDFVINLKKTVDTRYSADLNLKKRMEALNADPLQLNEGLVIPPSHRARPVPAAAAIPAPAVDTRPYPPPGYILKGNVWMGPNTVVPEDFYKKPPALPAAPASPAPAAPLTGQALLDALRDAAKND